MLIEHVAHPEMVQAVGQEEVLAPRLPLQLRPAARDVGEVGAEPGLGDGLDSTEHHRPAGAVELLAVLHVEGPVLAIQVTTQPVRHQHRVGVELDRPVVALPRGDPLHAVPRSHEQLRVAGRAVLRRADRDVRDRYGVDWPHGTVAQGERGGRQEVLLVAGHDADAHGDLLLGNVCFVAGADDREAVEGRVPPRLVLRELGDRVARLRAAVALARGGGEGEESPCDK
mmetsp:Transcript_97241/g.251551  ORF Transcript_97241/g.251551 Transcript_97241/m.251551 type:complete len:227 (-) Transcript_97241:503-1183(-)